VADAGFLELVRLGIKSAYDLVIINSLQVVDAHVGTTTPHGLFWHCHTLDGYGEMSTGAPWALTPSATFMSHGRLWPWTHAQFIRLAFDIAAGSLLEQPSIVADRYLRSHLH
jgi:hypothetical protein